MYAMLSYLVKRLKKLEWNLEKIATIKSLLETTMMMNITIMDISLEKQNKNARTQVFLQTSFKKITCIYNLYFNFFKLSDCNVVHFRSVLMKRHLIEHNNQNDVVENEISNMKEKVKVISKGTTEKEIKPFIKCPTCYQFRSNNRYILDRHQKSCETKMEDDL